MLHKGINPKPPLPGGLKEALKARPDGMLLRKPYADRMSVSEDPSDELRGELQ